MSSTIPLVLALALATTGFTAHPPQAGDGAKDGAALRAKDTADVLARLIRETDELSSFEAVYRASSSRPDSDARFRLVYRAPDRALVEFEGPDMSVTLRCEDGVFDFRATDPKGRAQFAHCEIGEPMVERRRATAGLIRAALPRVRDDLIADRDVELALHLFTGKGAAAGQSSLEFRAYYTTERAALCGWLAQFDKALDDVTLTDDQLVLRQSTGARIVVSRRTGFVERMEWTGERGPASFRLESLDLDPTIAAADLAIDPPASDAVDLSSSMSRSMQHGLTDELRQLVFEAVIDEIGTGHLEWNAESRSRVRTLLESTHADGFVHELAAFLAETRERIHGLESWLREQAGAATAGAAEHKAQIEERVREWRDQLSKTIDGMEAASSSFPPVRPRAGAEDLRTDLEALDGTAVTAAFQRVVREAVLDHFDERVEEARAR